MVGSILTAVLATLIIVLVFVGGLRRGMDHVVEGLPNDRLAIAVAVSDIVYHLNAGYLAYATVYHKLDDVWSRGASDWHDPAMVRNNADGDLLNEGLREAASLGPQQPGFVSDRSLVTMIYSDLGYVDFAKLAIRIFGLKIESFYYAYFLLLVSASVAFLVVFWSDVLPRIMLLFTLFAFFIEMHTAIFTPHMPTFPGLRHGSTLALVPLWHFAFLVIYRRRPSVVTVAATLMQFGILLLAIKMRGSAAWVVVFVVVLAALTAGSHWFRATGEQRTWPRLLHAALQWPIVLLFAGLLLQGEYWKATLHPVYLTDDVLPYHEFWEGAYLGIFLKAPELLPENSRALEIGRTTHNADMAGFAASAEYLNDTRFMPLPPDFPRSFPPGFMSPWTGSLKFRLNNEVMQRIVFRIAARHPFGMLKLYLVTKPIWVFEVVRAALGSVTLGWPPLLVVGATVALCVVFIVRGAIGDFPVGTALILVAGSLPFSALPNLWTFPMFHTLADVFLMTLVFLQLLIFATLVLAVRRLSARGNWLKQGLASR
jgi:hypothetical protein